MTSIAYLICANKLENVLIKNKIFSFLYKAGALKQIPVAMFNYAKCLKNGKGVKKNLDLACEFYYRAMSSGYLEARKYLDEIYQYSTAFKQNHPDYKILESKDYEDFEDKEIILL